MITNIILIFLGILIIAFYVYMHNYLKKRKYSNWYKVGCFNYTPENKFVETNFPFADKAKLLHHTSDFIPVIFSDDEHVEFKKGDILLFTDNDIPEDWRNHYVLFQNGENKYRIVKCTSYDKITNFPPLFDGSETPGIGYTIIGFLQYIIRDKENNHIVHKMYF